MIRQLALRQTTTLRAGLVPATRYISTTPARYSIIGSAKEVLHKANKKIGEVAAEGIDKTQKATPHSVGEAAEKVNKKTGEVLAEGIEKTQQAGQKARVSQNAKGYESLQDKGSKAETEQNRPDDAL
mmetsp:Transcript_6722/g.6620  ORF Transcript_6722/g.6620 Transcript_6722/m.6620 type:complete len:127 (-) Transcript_6722:1914-2294(-)